MAARVNAGLVQRLEADGALEIVQGECGGSCWSRRRGITCGVVLLLLLLLLLLAAAAAAAAAVGG
jgi:hypothetical protein